MLCLRCGADPVPPPHRCPKCDWYLGIASEGGGFLPQLRELEKGLAEGEIQPERAEEMLNRLGLALEALAAETDRMTQQILQIGLDETQQGVLAGFLAPGREGLAAFYNVTRELDPAGGWSSESWEALTSAQRDILRGSEGVAFLMRSMAQMAGVPVPEISWEAFSGEGEAAEEEAPPQEAESAQP